MELLRELFFERGNAAEDGVKLPLISLRVIYRLIPYTGRAEGRAYVNAAAGAEDVFTEENHCLTSEGDSAKNAIVD